MVNALKKYLSYFNSIPLFFPTGHTRKCDVILTLCVNFALLNIVPYFIKSAFLEFESVF